MFEVSGNTPVIIGVGQFSERVGEPGYAALSYMDLAGRALAGAISDSGASGDVASAIDTLAAIRAFEMSRPDRKPPFGAADNVPRAIAKRVGGMRVSPETEQMGLDLSEHQEQAYEIV